MKKLAVTLLFFQFTCASPTTVELPSPQPSSTQVMNTMIAQEIVALVDATSEIDQLHQEDDIGALVLSVFANEIVTSFFALVQAPNNPAIVAPCIANILKGIVKIAMKAIKGNRSPKKAREQEILAYVLQESEKLIKRLEKLNIQPIS